MISKVQRATVKTIPVESFAPRIAVGVHLLRSLCGLSAHVNLGDEELTVSQVEQRGDFLVDQALT